ncbi:hypothetical protein F0M18_14395 [Pseudohalioglobus sediminis]|uniref:AsmA family protein n=1 Tax=Pseudohalioglobus sediminis TaxID=2606449 RepID=A0A5B0WRG7_9GAMM|nr:hypothetical protein [Pseudohalioglobus sediminis]KAA1189543.1 hypothetical protein F0M18_14395 [Pseudohalioglobus sediminis]
MLLKRLALLAAALSLLLAAALGAAYAWLQHDPQNIRVPLEWLAGHVLDRELRIGEVTTVQLGQHTRLAARDVTLDNPGWATEAYFAQARYLEVELDLPSLWRQGPVVLDYLELAGASLNLQQTGDRPGNWDFWPDAEPSPDAEDGPLPIIISRALVHDSIVKFVDDDQDVTAALQRVHLSEDSAGMLALAASGSINGFPLQASTRAGPSRALFTGRDLDLDLELSWGQLQATLGGTAGDLGALENVAMQWSLQSPTSRPLLNLLGAHEVRDGPIDLRGSIATTGSGLQVDARGQLDAFALVLNGDLGKPEQLDDLDLSFDLSGPSLHEAGTVLDLRRLPDVPFALSGSLSRQGRLLVFDSVEAQVAESQLTASGRLPDFPDIDDWRVSLRGSDIDLALLGPALGREQLPERRFSLAGDLSSNAAGVELLNMVLNNEDSRLEISGIVGEAPEYAGTELELQLSGDDISGNAPWIGLEGMPETPFTLTATVHLDEHHWVMQQAELISTDLVIGMRGKLERSGQSPGIDAYVQASTPDLSATLAAYQLHSNHIPPLPAAFSGQVSGNREQLHLRDGKLALGQASAAINGTLGRADSVAGMKLRVHAETADFRELLESPLPGKKALGLELAAELHADNKAIHLRGLSGQMGNDTVTFDADTAVYFQDAKPKVRGEFDIAGASISKLQTLLELDLPLTDGAFNINANIAGDAGVYRVSPLSATFGESDLNGSIELRQGDTPGIHAALRSKQLHLPSLLPDPEDLEAEEEARGNPGDTAQQEDFSDELTAAELKERIIPDRPLPLAWMRHINASLEYSAETIYLREDASSQGSLALRVADGKLSVAPVVWGGTYTAGRAMFSLDATTDDYAFTLMMDGERFPLLWLVAGEPDYTAKSMFKASLTGQGNTARAMAASLNGGVLFHGEGGRVTYRGMDLIMGDLFSEILDALNPATQRKPHTRVKCNAGALSIKDGVAEAIPGFMVRTSKSDILAAGSINLKNERLDLAFSTRSRKGLGISAGRTLSKYVKLGGTLANPKLTLDATAAAVQGSAAIATAGWSILAGGIWDRWIATAGDPCGRLIKQAQKDKRRDYDSLLQLGIPGTPSAERADPRLPQR